MSKTYFKLFNLIKKFSIHKYAVSSIQPIDRALSGATTPGQSGPGSDGNEGVLHIPQSSSIAGTSPSDCLVSYQDTRCGVGLTSQCILQPQPTGQVTICAFLGYETTLYLVVRLQFILTRRFLDELIGCVLLHINHFRLFNAKSCLNNCIKYDS